MRSGGDPKRALVAGRTGPRIVTGANALLQLLLPAVALAPAAVPGSFAAPVLRLLATSSLCLSLAILAFIDARTRTLPRGIVRPLYAGGLAYAFLGAQLRFPGDVHALTVEAASSLLVGAAAAGMLVVLSAAIRLLGRRRDAVGTGARDDDTPPVGAGDIRLILALGIMLGGDLLPVLLVACMAACAYALVFRRPSFPFGPFLAAPAMVVLIASALVGLP